MEHEPSGFLRNAKVSVNLVGANAVLAVDQHPQSYKPFAQRHSGILENGPDFDGKLMRTLLALPALLRREVIVLSALTLGAFWLPSGQRMKATVSMQTFSFEKC